MERSVHKIFFKGEGFWSMFIREVVGGWWLVVVKRYTRIYDNVDQK